MKASYSLLFLVIGTVALAGEGPLVMSPFRVRPSDLLFKISYVVETDAITEIRVTQVIPGSAAERVGIRKGDRLVSVRGTPVIGKARRSLLGKDGRISALGLLTFEGSRGLFRRHWSLTVESSLLRESERPNKAPEPTITSVTSPAAQEQREP